jgi:hypothetical protein
MSFGFLKSHWFFIPRLSRENAPHADLALNPDKDVREMGGRAAPRGRTAGRAATRSRPSVLYPSDRVPELYPLKNPT